MSGLMVSPFVLSEVGCARLAARLANRTYAQGTSDLTPVPRLPHPLESDACHPHTVNRVLGVPASEVILDQPQVIALIPQVDGPA